MDDNVRKRTYYIYIYNWGHFAVQQKLTEHCKSTIMKNKFLKNRKKILKIKNKNQRKHDQWHKGIIFTYYLGIEKVNAVFVFPNRKKGTQTSLCL